MSESRKHWLVAGLLLPSAFVMAAEEPVQKTPETKDKKVLESVVVTAEKTDEPLTVVTDAKAPRQPVPAHDGADYLKTIPGFNVIRKGGTDGDPVFRGMAGSRLNVLLDGEMLLGGCGGRMDPPTAYVFPESYDTVTVVKGPQTVLHGPGNSAGVVLFERDNKRRSENGVNFTGSALVGGFARRDEMFDVNGGTRDFYARGTVTNAQQGDYKDGDGDEVHSQYHRYSANGAFGWTPDDDTLLEVTMAESDGEAAYADRSVDGSMFERENAGIKYRQDNLTEVLASLEAQVYYNYIDHVMDNYSLRELSGMMAMPMAMNPDRKTEGARFATTLAVADSTQLTVGIDAQQNEHSNRMTMNQTAMPYEDMKRVDDAEFSQVGRFFEVTHHFTDSIRLIGGRRYDYWQAKDERDVVALNMMMTVANPTIGETRHDHLASGFVRYEQDFSAHTIYAGVGRSERFPDYWEMIAKQSATTASAFDTDVEKTNQLDMGLLHKTENLDLSVSAFYSKVDDFILVDYTNMKKMQGYTRNVDATTYGTEASAAYMLAENWKVDGSVAWVWGENETDDTALAQLPPLEGRVGLTYLQDNWSVGGLMRVVDDQDRYDLNRGNIVGKDLEPAGGFTVFSLNGSWKATDAVLLTAGVDNLFDKTYAEHISRSGEAVSGFVQTDRVNEPGRTLWLKVQMDL